MSNRSLTERIAAALMPPLLSRLRLRARFMLVASFSVLAFGALDFVFVDALANRLLDNQMEAGAFYKARRLAAACAPLLLQEDMRGLDALVASAAGDDSDPSYALIVAQDGSVRASTFTAGVPTGLADANRPGAPRESSIIASDRGRHYRDVAVPIAGGRLGYMRVGVGLGHIQRDLRLIHIAVGATVATLLLLGLVGSHFTAHVVAAPVERLAAAARAFDPAHPVPALGPGVAGNDELADLVHSFDRMAARVHQLNDEQHTFQERIVRAERLATVGTLAAGVAHEIGSPLAGIRNCLVAIQREPEDIEQTREYSRMMIDATRTIERTLRSIVDVAARSRPQAAPVDPRSVCDRVRLLVRHRFAAAGVGLDIEANPPPAPIVTDEGLLQQVIVNLLINACDASPAGERVVVRVRGQGASLSIDVVDHGPGIAAEVRDHLFEPFVTTKADRGGTGLGLAMAQQVVGVLGGSIAFESEPGHGTRFTVELPTMSAGPSAT